METKKDVSSRPHHHRHKIDNKQVKNILEKEIHELHTTLTSQKEFEPSIWNDRNISQIITDAREFVYQITKCFDASSLHDLLKKDVKIKYHLVLEKNASINSTYKDICQSPEMAERLSNGLIKIFRVGNLPLECIMNEKEILLKTRDINDTGKDRFFKTNDDSVHHILEKIFKLLDLQKSVEVTEYQGKLVDLFQEDLRFQIFWVLYKNRNKPMTVKQILDECNKKLDILGNDVKGHSDDKKIISAFRRHLGILEKAKFIQDTPIRKANLRNKLYQLSSVGELIIKSMRGTRAILNNIDFINTHDFKNLPDAFVNSIGSLLYCEVIRSELKVIKRIKEVYDKAIEDDLTREFWTLNPIIPEFLTEKAMDFSNKREKKNFVYHQVVPKVVHVSKARTTLINKNRLWINLNQVSVLLRVVDTMTVFMVCNGSEGVLIFQKKDGDIDLSQALYGNTGEFVSLCKTLFYEFWNVGDPFDGKNVKFIDDLE